MGQIDILTLESIEAAQLVKLLSKQLPPEWLDCSLEAVASGTLYSGLDALLVLRITYKERCLLIVKKFFTIYMI